MNLVEYRHLEVRAFARRSSFDGRERGSHLRPLLRLEVIAFSVLLRPNLEGYPPAGAEDVRAPSSTRQHRTTRAQRQPPKPLITPH
jgi:hypothetical protein